MKRWERNEDRIIRKLDGRRTERVESPTPSVLAQAAFNQLFRQVSR